MATHEEREVLKYRVIIALMNTGLTHDQAQAAVLAVESQAIGFKEIN
jgi:hypothetical protein